MKRKSIKKKEIKDTYNRSRMKVTEYVISICTKKYSDGKLLPECGKQRGVTCNYLHNVEIPIGSLCLLDCAPFSKFYLSWYLGEKDGEYYLQSIEDHSVARWVNAVIHPFPLEMTEGCPQFRYSDRQFSFQDRWENAVKKNNYWLVPLYSIFNEENEEVTLRLRRKFEDEVFECTLPSWRKASNNDLKEAVEKIVNEKMNNQSEEENDKEN